MLELRNGGDRLIALSTTALGSLTSDQRRMLERHGGLCPLDISTIERAGGGSVRCMIAEIFLPGKHA